MSLALLFTLNLEQKEDETHKRLLELEEWKQDAEKRLAALEDKE